MKLILIMGNAIILCQNCGHAPEGQQIEEDRRADALKTAAEKQKSKFANHLHLSDDPYWGEEERAGEEEETKELQMFFQEKDGRSLPKTVKATAAVFMEQE